MVMKAGRPQNSEVEVPSVVAKVKSICECNVTSIFKGSVCPKCGAECIDADSFLAKQRSDDGFNSPKIMKSSGKIQNARKPVYTQSDLDRMEKDKVKK